MIYSPFSSFRFVSLIQIHQKQRKKFCVKSAENFPTFLPMTKKKKTAENETENFFKTETVVSVLWMLSSLYFLILIVAGAGIEMRRKYFNDYDLIFFFFYFLLGRSF